MSDTEPTSVDPILEDANGVREDAVAKHDPAEAAPAVAAVAARVTSGHSAEGSAERRAARRAVAKPRERSWLRRAWIVAAVLGAVIVCAVGADVALSWDRIHPGVRIGGIAVGSMTREAARRALDDTFTRAAAEPVDVMWEGAAFPVTGDSIRAALDATASIDAAMEVGRRGTVLDMIGDRVVATFAGMEVATHASDDADDAAGALEPITVAVAQPARDAAVSVSGTTVKVVPSRAGRRLDVQATLSVLLAAVLNHGSSVDAVLTSATPVVSDAAAQLAADAATSLISGPVRITYESRWLDVPRETVARWVVFVRSDEGGAGSGSAAETTLGAAVTLSASFDSTRVASSVSTFAGGLGRPAKDASFVAEKGSVRIVASQVGHGPDVRKLASDLAAACASGGSRTAALELTETQPALTTAAAKDMGISERISTFTTTYSTSNPARTNNIHLLARAFDGKLVAPGAVFSFNGSAGQRTAAKGYQEAPAIVNGKLVPQLGGGVCQVGTTFFNTVFFSGLPIVERHNHSFYISHYPTGRDATVSWGGPDFKFRNDTKNWILIRTATTSNSLTIALYGTDPGYNVEYKTGAFTDLVPHSVQEIKDPKLPKGKRVVEDGGVDGRRISVTRTVYLGGQVVGRDTFVSRYNPKLEVVRVGTKPSTTPSGTVTP